MRKAIALLVGLGIAIFLGWLYMKFSGPLVYKEPQPGPTSASAAGNHNQVLYAIVLFCWLTAFLSMPRWLAIIVDMGVIGLGLIIFVVTGVLVGMMAPYNTLQDGNYVAFLCSIAMLASRVVRILK